MPIEVVGSMAVGFFSLAVGIVVGFIAGVLSAARFATDDIVVKQNEYWRGWTDAQRRPGATAEQAARMTGGYDERN